MSSNIGSTSRDLMHLLFGVWVIHAALNQFARMSTASIMVYVWHWMTTKTRVTTKPTPVKMTTNAASALFIPQRKLSRGGGGKTKQILLRWLALMNLLDVSVMILIFNNDDDRTNRMAMILTVGITTKAFTQA